MGVEWEHRLVSVISCAIFNSFAWVSYKKGRNTVKLGLGGCWDKRTDSHLECLDWLKYLSSGLALAGDTVYNKNRSPLSPCLVSGGYCDGSNISEGIGLAEDRELTKVSVHQCKADSSCKSFSYQDHENSITIYVLIEVRILVLRRGLRYTHDDSTQRCMLRQCLRPECWNTEPQKGCNSPSSKDPESETSISLLLS